MRKRTEHDINVDLFKNDMRGAIVDGMNKYEDLEVEDIVYILCSLAANEASFLMNDKIERVERRERRNKQ